MTLDREILSFLERPQPERFEELAIRLYQIQRAKNRPYDLYCRALEVPGDVSSWKEIPGLPQQAFKYSEIRSFPAAETRFEFRTSGTTGEGYGRHFLPSLDLYEKAVQRGWDWAGLPRWPIGLLMSTSIQTPHSSLAQMGMFLNRGAHSFWKDTGNLDLDRLRIFAGQTSGPITLLGTALAFLDLLEHSTESPLRLPKGSLLMETGGFKGSSRVIEKSELYRRLADHFRIPTDDIWNEYGMTELSSQFYASGADGFHHGPPWTGVTIIDPATNRETPPGVTGMIRIIDLANFWSVLAVQTQDLAQHEGGAAFRLLGRDPNALPRGCSRAVDEVLQKDRQQS
jgi:Acyl-protein synthetase, LuxE